MWDSKSTPFKHEAWAEYGIGVAVILLRIAARLKIVRWNWHGDDYFIILVLFLWSGELAMLELIGRNGTNIGLSAAQRGALTPVEIEALEFGTKCNIAGWIMYTSLIWSLKACMLFFFARLTIGLYMERMVKIAAVVCACAYCISMVTILTHCRPIEKNWQVTPDPGDLCTLGVPNYIAITLTNLLTDGLLLSIPLPLLARVRIPLARKLVIGVLLCGGVFIMIATLLRCILSLQAIHGVNVSIIWAVRESFVAILAVNAPCIKPIFSPRAWATTSGHSTPNKPSSNTASGYQLSKISRSNFDQLSIHRFDEDRGSEEFGFPFNQSRLGLASHASGDTPRTSSIREIQSPKDQNVATTYDIAAPENVERCHREDP